MQLDVHHLGDTRCCVTPHRSFRVSLRVHFQPHSAPIMQHVKTIDILADSTHTEDFAFCTCESATGLHGNGKLKQQPYHKLAWALISKIRVNASVHRSKSRLQVFYQVPPMY